MHTKFLALAALCLSASVPALADTIVTNLDSTPAYNTWYANNVRTGGTVGITNTYPDNGTGSIQFTATNSSLAKADAEYYFTTGISLSDVNAFSYDLYRSSSSTASAKYDPAMRLYVTDGTHSGYLVYEPIYNGGPVATDQFVTANILNSFFWSTGTLDGAFSVYNRTLSDWAALDPALKIYGFSTGIGSGWDGTFDGAVDNITFGVKGAAPTTYNFETSAVAPTPEPNSLLLLATGLLGGGGMLIMRRRNSSLFSNAS